MDAKRDAVESFLSKPFRTESQTLRVQPKLIRLWNFLWN